MPAGQGVVEGNDIPYQDWATAKKKENFANRSSADPIAKCYLPGVPRITYMPYPFQIFQTGGIVGIVGCRTSLAGRPITQIRASARRLML